MSVAEQTYSERVPRSPQALVAGGSFVGAVYVLGSLIFIFGGLPALWGHWFPKQVVNEFLSGALLLLASLVAIVLLGYVGYRLEKASEVKGLRGGIFVASVVLWLVLWSAVSFGNIQGVADLEGFGMVLTVGLVVALLFAAFRIFLTPGFYSFLVSFEEQGWFSATPFKPSQGAKVRRATMVGLLVLGGCGIFTMINHHTLGSDRLAANDWYWRLPFTTFKAEVPSIYLNEVLAGEKALPTVEEVQKLADPTFTTVEFAYFLPLMHKIHVTVPLVLAALLIWMSWRVVNWPIFADFLIATEAEINKVSWTTRKRLFQDTIVVLVTVAILTTFLFLIDIMWVWILTGCPWNGKPMVPFVQVLQVDLSAEQRKQQEKTQW